MNLQEVLDFVPPAIRDAALQTARQLSSLGIRHAIAGGLAVGAHGYLRATKDVDFLVGDEAFEHHGALVTFRPGVPIQVGGVLVDYLSPQALGQHLESVFEAPSIGSVPVVPIEALVFMKLLAGRRQDLLDVVKLIEARADVDRIRDYLMKHASDLLPGFEKLAQEALD